jgi:type IX secretion system PorP/SprF family membrane protein
MRRIIFSILLLMSFFDAHAQQDPHYTQYMYNMSVFNPAYAGSKEAVSTGLLYRRQWIELEDAPATATLFAHAPVGKNVGLGISFINDRIGPVQENNIYADFSYTLRLSESHKLAFGLKGGFTLHNVALNSRIASTLPDPTDGAFGQDTNNGYFNLGSGLFFYTDKYYLGASVPNFLKGKHLDYNGRSYGNEESHYFFTGGYVFDLNENFKFKPFFMVKSSFKAPASFDVSANFLMYDKFEAGLTYRKEDSFGLMLNYGITKDLRIGYAYDHIVSDIKVTTPSSHEVILLYDFNLSKRVSRSPRFF